MTLRQEKGRAGEDAAADWLEKAGMRILARNWRSGSYELDLVCRDGDELVFVEVRLRGKGSLASPEASMTRQMPQRGQSRPSLLVRKRRMGCSLPIRSCLRP